jgi:hypothetical protein
MTALVSERAVDQLNRRPQVRASRLSGHIMNFPWHRFGGVLLLALNPTNGRIVSRPGSWRRLHFSVHPDIMIGQIKISRVDEAIVREPDFPELAGSTESGPAGCL